MSKGKSHAMGIASMIAVLGVVVALSTIAMRYVYRNLSGFEDLISGEPIQVPGTVMASDQTPTPDRNTAFLCRSPNGSGNPCPEGQFCDGKTQNCLPVGVFGSMSSILPGFFS